MNTKENANRVANPLHRMCTVLQAMALGTVMMASLGSVACTPEAPADAKVAEKQKPAEARVYLESIEVRSLGPDGATDES